MYYTAAMKIILLKTIETNAQFLTKHFISYYYTLLKFIQVESDVCLVNPVF